MASPVHALRPGVPVLTRAPGVLQVGLTDPRVRLPDRPAIRSLLAALSAPDGLADVETLSGEQAEALERLLTADLAMPALPARSVPPGPGLLALTARTGSDAVRRHAARQALAVAVHAPAGARALLDPMLADAGLTVVAPEDAGVHLLVANGPVDRDRLDAWVRASLPHLIVTGDATGVRVGPFVVPGRTACLRCVDAHESLRDERLPLLLAQAARQCAQRPPPRDPVLDRLALAWAVRDLTLFAEGDVPSTWSASVDLGGAAAPELTRWGRHPYCGCAWDGFLDLP